MTRENQIKYSSKENSKQQKCDFEQTENRNLNKVCDDYIIKRNKTNHKCEICFSNMSITIDILQQISSSITLIKETTYHKMVKHQLYVI